MRIVVARLCSLTNSVLKSGSQKAIIGSRFGMPSNEQLQLAHMRVTRSDHQIEHEARDKSLIGMFSISMNFLRIPTNR
jgi:hypothetical protein